MLNYPVVPVSHRRTATPLPARIATATTAVAMAVWSWYRRWKTIRELSALDDRTLKDIGVDRTEIGSIAAGCNKDRTRLLNYDLYRLGR